MFGDKDFSTQISAFLGGYNISKIEESRGNAATTIQSLVRGHQARNSFGELLEQKERDTAATTIQSLVRGYQARNTFRKLLEQRDVCCACTIS